MKKILSLILLLYHCTAIYCQNQQHTIDSIYNLIATSTGTQKVDLLMRLYEEEIGPNPDTALYFIKQANQLAKEFEYHKGIIESYINLGEYYDHQAEYFTSAKQLLLANEKAIQIKDSLLIAESTYLTANAFYKSGEYDKGLSYAIKGIKIYEVLKDKRGIFLSQNTCGNIYTSLKKHSLALEYFNKNLVIALELNNDENIATALNNIGLSYQGLGQHSKALEYFEKALVYSNKINDHWVAASYLNIGIAYGDLNENEKAIENFKKTLNICKKTNFLIGLLYANNYLGGIYIKLSNYSEALKYLNDALAIGEKTEAMGELSETYNYLAIVYRNSMNYKKADEYFQLHAQLKDSILNETSTKQITEMEAKYNSEKQEQAILLLNKDAEIKKAELGKSNMIKNYSLGIGTLILILAFVLFRSNKNKQKANEILTTQKEEILSQRDFIESQKNVLEYQKKEITDSINYAKRIQQAILPPQNELDKHVAESFVVYIPKDIVAGDFFWIEKIDEQIFFAAADCTGHGVPGAMVSVICNNALNRALREFELRVPGQLLDKTREIVIQQFEKSEDEVKDGMDISFCSLNTKTNELSWAGANNPLWIIHNNELIEIKPDKQPIGKYADLKPYLTHKRQLFKGDSVYIFTDGFADQFGGEKGKKFKSSSMKELFQRIQSNSMLEQKNLIIRSFNQWKGSLEQVDDICVMGLRI